VDREFEDLQALIGLAGGSAFVHGFSSGATLALLAAERGLGITKLSLLEPPLRVGATPPPAAPGISGEVARLIIAGRRGDAYEHWMTGIGVPAEMIAQMRDGPLWPALEATAHTLVYESFIPGSLPPDRLAAISTPALVVASQGSTGQLRAWAQTVADALPERCRAVPARHLARGTPRTPRTRANRILHRPLTGPTRPQPRRPGTRPAATPRAPQAGEVRRPKAKAGAAPPGA
jgi:hypothetical protein